MVRSPLEGSNQHAAAAAAVPRSADPEGLSAQSKMNDHVVLYVDGHERRDANASSSNDCARFVGGATEEQPLIQMGECRICQDEDTIQNLESPCACSGSLKYAHQKCVQHWCDEKGDTMCEICHQPFQPNYTARSRLPGPENAIIDIGGGWTISGTPLDLQDPRLIAITETERQFMDADYDDYGNSNANGAAFCRSVALILMTLLLLRHALTIPDKDEEDDPSAYFSLFLLRAAGFLLPCYMMAWAINILQHRRQRQEAAASAARRVAFILQAGHSRGVHFAVAPTMAPANPVAAHQESQPLSGLSL
ncbi:hypothetical protein SAY86_008111 [Trapa natans]|uniref:RING-CH-type domain-containing protein n=1 Tax=Trapa natans TaxID=22666 RepID=A0AAN7K5T1_TRANT|nr:hypothetical protein SAY86_008111 [Trapa natans]